MSASFIADGYSDNLSAEEAYDRKPKRKWNIVAIDPIQSGIFISPIQPKVDKHGFEEDVLKLSNFYNAKLIKEDEEVNKVMDKGGLTGFKLLTNVRHKSIPDKYEYVGGVSTVFGHTTIVVMNIAERMVVFAESRNKRDKTKMLDDIATRFGEVYFFE